MGTSCGAAVASAEADFPHPSFFPRSGPGPWGSLGVSAAADMPCPRGTQVTDLYDPREQWASYLINALKAKELQQKDVNYIVKQVRPPAARGPWQLGWRSACVLPNDQSIALPPSLPPSRQQQLAGGTVMPPTRPLTFGSTRGSTRDPPGIQSEIERCM